MRETIDIEGALVAALKERGTSASAPPVPSRLGSTLPHVHVTRTGGDEVSIVQDRHRVDVDVYAATSAAAMSAVCELTGWLRSLVGSTLGGVPVYDARVDTLPYDNPDPLHPTIPRATFKASLVTRVQH